jgi:hypothetical protein
MQMTRATWAMWLSGTTASLSDDGLTIVVASDYASDWLRNRLHPLIQRTVDGLAGRPLPVTYVAGLEVAP